MKNTGKIYSTIGLVITSIVLIVFATVNAETVGAWEDLSMSQMDRIVGGGSKHCDNAGCPGYSCSALSGGGYGQKVSYGVTGRLCIGTPCTCCIASNYTPCAMYYSGCNSTCTTCTSNGEQNIPTACASG